jgi:predicted PurR-regulated permease PerM
MATFIPYASALSTSIVSVLLAFQDVKLGLEVLLTAIILGQIMDNVVAPRVLGNVTGLNPVWLIVSLLIGAKFGGVLGLLIVVPLASFIKRTVDKLNVMALDQPDLIPSDEGE